MSGLKEPAIVTHHAGGRLTTALHEPARAVEAGHSGHGPSGGSGGAIAVCAYHGTAPRRGQPAAVGNGQGCERELGSPRSGAGRFTGRVGLASGSSRRHGLSPAERAVGTGLRHDDQAALRPSGEGVGELQPEEAGASLACLPCVSDGGHAACSGCRGSTGQPSPFAALSSGGLPDRLSRDHWPRLVRGDKDWSSEGNIASCEAADLDYLFNSRLTRGARRCSAPCSPRAAVRLLRASLRHIDPCTAVLAGDGFAAHRHLQSCWRCCSRVRPHAPQDCPRLRPRR